MSDRVLQSLVHAVRRRAAEDPAAGSDVELLSRFVLTRDTSAFELLVWRHGAMVEAVCRRVLGRSADVEDAFQATFMALLKQARSIRRQSSAAPWLHRVALRVSLRLRRSADRRLKREKASVRAETISGSDPDLFELGTILHEEIDQLPARFRLPLVMCFLEGRSVAEASSLLGVPRGTVLSRLSRARERLRRVLVHRGLAPAVAAVLGLAEANKSVSASLVRVTLESIKKMTLNNAMTGPVARVAEGVIRDMMLKKIRMTVCVAAVVGLIGAGTAFISLPQAQAQPDRPGNATRRVSDLERLQGDWNVVTIKSDGRTMTDAIEVAVHGKTLTMNRVASGSKPLTHSISLDPSTSPRSIDLHGDGQTMPGIYEFNGDNLKLCFCENGPDRPEEFASQRGAHVVLMTLKRHPGAVAIGSVAADEVQALRAENSRLRELLAQEKRRNANLVARMNAIQANAQAIEKQIAENLERAAAERDLAEANRRIAEARQLSKTDEKELRLFADRERELQEAQRQILRQREMVEAERALALAAQRQLEKAKISSDEIDRAKGSKSADGKARIEAQEKLLAEQGKHRELAELEQRRALEMELQARAKLIRDEQQRAAIAKAQADKAVGEAQKELFAERDQQRAMAERMKLEALDARREAEMNAKRAKAERDQLEAALRQAEAAVAEAEKRLRAERDSKKQLTMNQPLDVGAKPECEVEWKGTWFPAKIVKKEKDRWLIHYVGYESEWDEWVGKDRIRFQEKK